MHVSYACGRLPGLAVLLSVVGAGSMAEGQAMVDYRNQDYSWQVPVSVRFDLADGGDIERRTHIIVTPLAYEDERNFAGLFVGVADVELRSGGVADRNVENPWLAEVGVTYRRYFSPSDTAFSPYLSGSIGYQYMMWEYRDEPTLRGERFSRDGLGSVDGRLAVGVTTMRDANLGLFGEVGVGATGFWYETDQGLDSNAFDSFLYVSVEAGICFKF